MTALREAAQQALEALEYHVEQTRPIHRTSEAITNLRAALAEQRLTDVQQEMERSIESLKAALASSCDEQRHELWESGGIAGCERARVAERQRDALLEALKFVIRGVPDTWEGVQKARAAIKMVEGTK